MCISLQKNSESLGRKQIIPTNFLKIERRKGLFEMGDRKKGDSEKNKNMVRNQFLKYLPKAVKRKECGRKIDVRRRAGAREAMKESRGARLLRGCRSEEMTQVNISSPRGSAVPLKS